MKEIEIVTSGLAIPEADQESALQIAANLDRAWNQRDAAAFAGLFDQEGDFRFPDGLWIKGREAIEGFWSQQVFPNSPATMHHQITPTALRFVTENLVLGDGVLRIVEREAGETVRFAAHGTLLAVRRAGRWLITAVRLAPLPSE